MAQQTHFGFGRGAAALFFRAWIVSPQEPQTSVMRNMPQCNPSNVVARTCSPSLSCKPARDAFTLAESLFASAIAAIAGLTLLTSVASTLQSVDEATDRTIANGIARQLMDEISTKRYSEPGAGALQVNLGPEAGEVSGLSRIAYDDIDDYDGYVMQPVVDEWGVPLGEGDDAGGQRHSNFQAPSEYFDRWRCQVVVDYVADADLALPLGPGLTSNHRQVVVAVLFDDPVDGLVEKAVLRRVFSPPPEIAP